MGSRSTRRTWILVVMAISLLAYARTGRADCTRDRDCKAGRLCVAGTCQRVKTCRADADCPGALVCEKKRCVAEDPPANDEPVGADSSGASAPTDAAMPMGDSVTFDTEWADAMPARPPGQRRSTCASCAIGDSASAWWIAVVACLLLARRRTRR